MKTKRTYCKTSTGKRLKGKSSFTLLQDQSNKSNNTDGYTKIFQEPVVKHLNACGPCIDNKDQMLMMVKKYNYQFFNRNFAKSNDGNAATESFVASPEIVTALTIAGKLSFNPISDKDISIMVKSLNLMQLKAQNCQLKGLQK